MFVVWIAVFLLVLFLPLILGAFFPEVKLILAFLVSLAIYNTVRQFFGDTITTLVLTAAAIYVLVIQHFWTATMLWWISLLLGMGLLSTVGWLVIFTGNIFKRK